MVSFQLQPRRLIVIAGVAAAIFAGQAFAVFANPTTDSITACSPGLVEDQYTRMCGTAAVPGSGAPAQLPVGAPSSAPPVGPPSEGSLTACNASPDQPVGPPSEMDLSKCQNGL
jgi:hypothetical protein